MRRSWLDVPPHCFRADFRTVDRTPRIHRDTLAGAGAPRLRLRRVGNQPPERAVPGAPDPDPALPVAVRGRHPPRFGVGNVNRVAPDVDAARPAELAPHREGLPILVEDLDPVVAPVPDEEPPPGIHRQGVGLVQLARTRAPGPEGFEQPPVLVELENPGVGPGRGGVPLRYEDVAVRGDQDVVRLVEIRGIPAPPRLAERHEQLPVRPELEDPGTLGLAVRPQAA